MSYCASKNWDKFKDISVYQLLQRRNTLKVYYKNQMENPLEWHLATKADCLSKNKIPILTDADIVWMILNERRVVDSFASEMKPPINDGIVLTL